MSPFISKASAGSSSAGADAPFAMPDVNSLRLPQDFAATVGVKPLLVSVPVTRPRKTWFVRTRPGNGWRVPVGMIVLQEEQESYVVDPKLAADLPDDVVQYELVAAVNRHGLVFLWPLRLPNSSRHDSWADSAIAASQHAETHWIRITANRHLSAYEVGVATGRLPEPEWPEHSFEELFAIAFRGRVIDAIDHPVIQKLKGAL